MVLVALHRPPQHSYPVGAALSRVYLRPRPSSSCTKCGCRYHGVGHFMCVPVAPPPGVNLRPVKPVTVEDVQKVHIMLECCIKRAMTKHQAVAQLQLVGVQPLVAALVWDRLEEENPTFFAAYHKQQAQQGLEQPCHAT